MASMAKSPHTMIRVLDEARSVAVYKAGLDLKPNLDSGEC